MKRRAEPELMDSEAQTRAYAEADLDESNSLFTRRFLERFADLPQHGRLADLGCGPGDITLRLSRALPGWELTGFDAGPKMLERARARLAAEPGQPRVSFRLAHLPDLTLPSGTWDALVSNSVLHHFPNPQSLWDTIVQLGVPGAAVQVMDLMRPTSDAQARRLVDQYTGGGPEVLRHDFYLALLAAYTPEEVSAQLIRAGLDRLKIETASDRHWIVSGRLAE